MRIEWFTDNSALERLRPEWNTLLQHSVTDTLFLTWEWQTTWWRCLGSGMLCIITVREEDGTLAGLLPLFRDAAPDGVVTDAGEVYSLIGCVDVSDYLDVLVAKGREALVYPALVDALAHPDFPAWEQVQFCTLPATSPTNTEFKALAQARGWDVEWRLHDVSPLIELPSTWDEYLATLDKKQRHEIRRKLRRIEEAGARWYRVEGEIDTAVADFIELHKKSQPDKHLFMDSRMERFFTEMARMSSQQGWLELEFLELESQRAAALFNFVYHNDVLVYNSGYDPVKYAGFSPGVTLLARSIQEAIAAKRRVYDFLRGDEEYKYRFGARDTQVYELHIRRR